MQSNFVVSDRHGVEHARIADDSPRALLDAADTAHKFGIGAQVHRASDGALLLTVRRQWSISEMFAANRTTSYRGGIPSLDDVRGYRGSR